MSDYLNNNNQTSLLFKKFQNKVQAAIDTTSNGTGGTSYSNEQKRSLTNIYNNSEECSKPNNNNCTFNK